MNPRASHAIRSLTGMKRGLLRRACGLAGLAAGPLHGAAPDPAQRTVAEALVATGSRGRIVYDEVGNVVKLALGRPPPVEIARGAKLPRGAEDEAFREILKLPHLKAIFLEMQPLSDAGYAVLARLGNIADVRIHHPIGRGSKPGQEAPVPATDRFAQFINDLPGLRVLQLKHIFTIAGDGMSGLAPQRELEHAELDTICAGPSALDFLMSAPRLRNLQLHRTSLNDAQFQELCAALQNLEVLELKPDRNEPKKDYITGRSLRGLVRCRKLSVLQLGWDWKEMTYRDGLDAFERMPALRQVTFGDLGIKGFGPAAPAVQTLHRARPDLLIRFPGTTLGGRPDQQPVNVDDGWTWGGDASMGRPFLSSP